jgi:hypothetical protein
MMTEVAIMLLIAFVLGYASGWDGHKVHNEINRNKENHPDDWFRM